MVDVFDFFLNNEVMKYFLALEILVLKLLFLKKINCLKPDGGEVCVRHK